MATVFRRVGGRKLTKVIASTREVQNGLDHHALQVAIKADAILKAHRREGDARIEIDKGDVDRYVVLSDERGLGAAMSMEYGRPEGTSSSWGPMEPLLILHTAAGLTPGGD